MSTASGGRERKTWTNLKTAAGLAAAALAVGCQEPGQPDAPVIRVPQRTPPTTVDPVRTPSTVPASQPSPVIASVGDAVVRKSELDELLYRAYGLNMLMLLVQRDMTREACRQQNVVVSDAEIKSEYDETLRLMFVDVKDNDDRERLLDQYLLQPRPRDQMSTRAEFDIIIETNARLRKLVSPSIKKAVTDDMLHQQFDEEYGAHVVIRDIMVSNMQEAAEVNRRLAAGEDFAKVAAQMNRDPGLKQSAGAVPPFTAKTSAALPKQFIDTAFKLQDGEVSDPLMLGGGFHIMKRERMEQPKAVKFDDVKDDLRKAYEFKVVQNGVNGLRARLAQQALAQLKISDAQLKEDFENRVTARDRLIKDRSKINEEMARQRTPATTQAAPATAPATATSAGPAAAPATKPMPAVAPAAAAPTTAAATAPATRP